jgi:Undecaprenyl-phosphate galactose phosphotransferase WbaP
MVLSASLKNVNVSDRPWLVMSLLCLGDLLAIVFSASLTFELFRRVGVDANLLFDPYRRITPAIFLFPVAYAMYGLYPAYGLGAVEELRRLSITTFFIYLVLLASTFFFRGGEAVIRIIFLVLVFVNINLVVLTRAAIRELFARKTWWGASVLILGGGKTAQLLIDRLIKNPSLGLKPLAILDDDSRKHGQKIVGVEVVGGIALANKFVADGFRWVVVAMPGVHRKRLNEVLLLHTHSFPHVVILPDMFDIASLWVSTRDLAGILSLEIREQLLSNYARIFKRLLDLLIILLVSPVLLPLFLLISILIKMDSSGRVFYSQDRLGKDGKIFPVYKFRSMFANSEERLQTLLDSDINLKNQYNKFHKIENDPRVTRFGRIIRRLSLDELPQLWNIFLGHMSLVGPRAYLPRELPKMQNHVDLILRVTPGLTGIWQVSGRNHLTFDERLELDSYYARNWSPWFDFYILARTVWVVLSGKGAV